MQEMKLIDAVAAETAIKDFFKKQIDEEYLYLEVTDCNSDILAVLNALPSVPAVPLDIHERMKREMNEEKQALIAGQETLQKALAERNAEIERLLTEFARLKEETTQPHLLINCDDKSGEVLRKVIKNQNAVCIPNNGATVEFLGKVSIRAEAIKEFAERIDTHFKGSGIHWLYEASLRQRIDNLVKEMVGDTE